MTRGRTALAALVYAALLAHLLFIPYAFTPLRFDEALHRLAAMRWVQLGSDQNVALVSRGLMFLPLGLLLAAWVTPQPRRRIELPALLTSGLIGCLWAVGLNLAQFWFPARTVSLNNLVAESIGVVSGGLLWSTLGARWLRWRQQLFSGGGVSISAALSGYVILYLIAILTPFDFVTSSAELSEKVASNLYALWVAPVGCGPAPCKLKFLATLLAAVPCGWWFAARRRGKGNAWVLAVPVALIVATIVELLHFLMVSGVSQGASVFLRASGMVIGAATYPLRRHLAAIDLNRVGLPAALILMGLNIGAVAYVAGWFRSQKIGITAGIARLTDIVWLPFFYQYYSPYQSTMYSAMVHAALYAPVGVVCWLGSGRRNHVQLWPATVLAGVLAFLAETSKVFLAGRLPDYSDVLIAAVSATATLAVLRLAAGAQHRPPDSLADPHADGVRQRTGARAGGEAAAVGIATACARLVGIVLLAIASWTVISFPVERGVLVLGLALYVVALLRFPTGTYLIAIPLLLPVLDLAPLSGRFFWDEFDVVLATTLGVRLVMGLPMLEKSIPLPNGALWLLFLSVLASTAVGVWPPAPLDANAFSNYLSSYNALRIFKGYVWAGAVLWLIWRDASAGRKVVPQLQIGLALGLFAATIAMFWVRVQFVGSLDLGTGFRASGLMSATHVGGAYLEATLVMLVPFALALAVTADRVPHRVLWHVAALLSAVAIVMTISRAALTAWIMSVVVFALVWWLKSRHRATALARHWRWRSSVAFLALIAVSVLVTQSPQLRERFAASNSDLALRVTHWKDTVDLMRWDDALRVFFGMGLGSFPREFYLSNALTQHLPAYRLERDARSGRRYLVLTGGHGMYMDQRVSPTPGSEVLLRGQVRSPQAGAKLSISLCEKSMLNSLNCEEASVSADPTWRPFEVRMLSPKRSGTGLGPSAPVSLSLHNGRIRFARRSYTTLAC